MNVEFSAGQAAADDWRQQVQLGTRSQRTRGSKLRVRGLPNMDEGTTFAYAMNRMEVPTTGGARGRRLARAFLGLTEWTSPQPA